MSAVITAGQFDTMRLTKGQGSMLIGGEKVRKREWLKISAREDFKGDNKA